MIYRKAGNSVKTGQNQMDGTSDSGAEDDLGESIDGVDSGAEDDYKSGGGGYWWW